MTFTYPALLLLQAAPGAGSTFLPIVVQMVAIFAIFYFLMIRPQQKQRRLHEERLRNLKKGDSIVTAGGIVGDVVHIKESGEADKKAMDDHITIKSGESRFVIERGRIARVTGADGTSEPSSR